MYLNPDLYSFTSNIDFQKITETQKQKFLVRTEVVSKVSRDADKENLNQFKEHSGRATSPNKYAYEASNTTPRNS